MEPDGSIIGFPHVNVNMHCKKFVEFKWDNIAKCRIAVRKYFYYDKVLKRLYVPRFDLPKFQEFCQMYGLVVTPEEIPLQVGKAVTVKMRPAYSPRDDLQASAIAWASGVTTSDPMRPIAIQTGKGKTYSAISSISNIGRRAMVCCPGMTEQWYEAVKQFTELTDDEIYVVSGMASFARLMSQIDKTLHPKIILVSITTLRMYSDGHRSYENFPPFDTLCDHLKVGVRVIDEAHKNFQANLIFDMRLTNAVTIPLTATFDNSSEDVIKIFDAHYPKDKRFGEKHYTRYVDIFSYAYSVGTPVPPRVYRGKDGYSQVKLESWLLSNKGKPLLGDILKNVYYPIMHSHYMNVAEPGEKCLVLSGTIDMCKYLSSKFKYEFAPKKSGIYVGGSKDEELKTNDIIVSTPQSAGTGLDIKNLRTTFATVSVRSAPLNKQMLGRLRELPSGNTPYYAYCSCLEIQPQVAHAEFREQILKPLGKSFTKMTLP